MKFREDQAIETYKSMISISVEGLKSLLLINGGAIVAILAYMGQAPQGRAAAAHMMGPLSFFVAGIFLCVLSFGGAYVTQFTLLEESVGDMRAAPPHHMRAVWLTAVFALLSVTCFATGSLVSVHVLSHYKEPANPPAVESPRAPFNVK